jgi:hypothetical protein
MHAEETGWMQIVEWYVELALSSYSRLRRPPPTAEGCVRDPYAQ